MKYSLLTEGIERSETSEGNDASIMKHKHSGNFSNHKNLMDMSVQTYNTFFGNNLLLPIVLLELQIGERYFTF